jgi:drug/metabolite transporter (DMT)-like permease
MGHMSSSTSRILLLFTGIFAGSTSVIMIKASAVHPALLCGYRLLVASALLAPLFLRSRRRHRGGYAWRHLGASIVPGLLLALHLITWTIGARLTYAANAALLVNLVPLVMPLLLFVQVREVVNRAELAGTGIALLGLLLLGRSDFHLDQAHLLGDLTCLGSMLLFALYLVAAKRNRDVPDLWLYIVPLYAVAGLLCFAMAVPMTQVWTLLPAREYLLLLGLALLPTITGHSLLNHSMRHLRGQLVSVANLHQFVFAGILAFLIFGEKPAWPFYPAAALVVTGAVIVVRSGRRKAGYASSA